MFVIMNSAVKYSKNGKDRKVFKVQILAKGAVFFLSPQGTFRRQTLPHFKYLFIWLHWV